MSGKRPTRRFFQFSPRLMLLSVVAISLLFARVAAIYRDCQLQVQIADELGAYRETEPIAPRWLRRLMGAGSLSKWWCCA